MENLDWLEWESKSCVEIDITQYGAFPKSVERVKISRKSDLTLLVIGKGAGSFQLSEHIHLRPGELTPYPEETIGRTESGELVRLKGTLLKSSHSLSDPFDTELGSFSIQAQVDEVEVCQYDLQIINHIEWLVNFSIGNYTFTRYTQRNQFIIFTRERSGGDKLQRNLSSNHGGNLDHFGCECTIGSKRWSLLLGQVPEEIASPEYRPGFVEFSDLDNCLPSENTKQIILMALSFTLGRQLASSGSTSLAEGGDRVSYTTRKVRLLGEQSAYRQPSNPPTPLCLPQYEGLEGILDEEKVSTVISAVATKMEELKLEYPLFLVWLAQNSPLDVRAAHLGAAIESLRSSYCTGESVLQTTHLPKKAWKAIRKALLSAFDIATTNLDTDIRESDSVLRQKQRLEKTLNELNNKSSNMKYPEFFDSISLNVGEVEWRSLKQRNRPAHGSGYLFHEYPGLSITTDALYTLFNRIVLKLTNAADCYIDYSTYGHPVRDINEPLGGPEGDGRAAIV